MRMEGVTLLLLLCFNSNKPFNYAPMSINYLLPFKKYIISEDKRCRLYMLQNPKMGQDLFIYLPSEITIDILSRLPVRSAMRCKCVVKSWLNLIETPEFVKSYKSSPTLAIFRGETIPNPYKIYEREDVLNHENNSKISSCKEAFIFDFPHTLSIHTSVDGLLFLCHNLCNDSEGSYDHLFVCNPVTREYINLPNPQKGRTKWWTKLHNSFGFGVNKTSGQYKLVRVFLEIKRSDDGVVFDGPHCQVYTLGTRSWRSINSPSNILFVYDFDSLRGAFLNGNFHWLGSLEGCALISCFDLESKLFTNLSLPHHDLDFTRKSPYCWSLSALREESLCLCDARPDHEIVIWLMKVYGDDKSWTKQYVIPKIGPLSQWLLLPRVIKVSKDDEVLLTKRDYPNIFFYSNETKSFKEIESIDFDIISAFCYTPGFLRLKTLFPVENVCSFRYACIHVRLLSFCNASFSSSLHGEYDVINTDHC